MSNDDEPEGGGNPWDRMSLNSLRRELEVQKGKTALAREEAHERIREGTKSKTPWGKILVLSTIGIVIMGGVVFAVRSALPPMEEWSLPEFILPARDAGTLADLEPDGPADIDAGADAGSARRVGSRPRPRGDGGPAPTKRPGDLDFGDSDDPIGGLTTED